MLAARARQLFTLRHDALVTASSKTIRSFDRPYYKPLLCSPTPDIFSYLSTHIPLSTMMPEIAHGARRLGSSNFLLPGLFGSEGLDGGLASCESCGQTELSVDTIDTVSGVQVLDQGDLVASCTSLSGNDGGVSQEVLPDL
jgi:hypothetical protein